MNVPALQARFQMLLLVTGILLPSIVFGRQSSGVDVCAAANGPTKKTSVVVRGEGQLVDEGLALSSASCPIAKTGYDQVPTVILVKVAFFSTPEVRTRFVRSQSESGLQSPRLNIEVRGILNCRARMRFIRSGTDIVGANGFGDFGLYKCEMSDAVLLRIEETREQPERRLPPKPK